MSAHVEQQLWSHARGQLPAEAAKDVDAHLSSCADCRRVFEQFKQAVVVVKPVTPPVLDDAAWSRIDSRVLAAAKKELARGASPFAFLFDNWRVFLTAGALAAAAVIVFFAVTQKQPVQTDAPAKDQLAKVEPSVVPPPRVETPPEVIAPPVEVVQLADGQSVKLGEPIATTDKRFLALPDGSRVGGVGEAQFRVNAASVKDVKLQLDRGTLVVAAAHAEGPRSFAVNAGEVEVVVVGTRFLVERDEAVTVVVEEGKVEVAANGQKHVVSAGETLVIETGGKGTRKKAVTPAARAAFKILKVEAPTAAKTTALAQSPLAQSQGSSAQRLSDEDTAEAPAEGGELALAKVADGGTKFGALTPPPLLLPGDSQPAPQKEEKKFDLMSALKRIDLKNINLDAPYPPVGMPMAEYRVHQLQRNADRGQCDRVVERADAWMTEFSAAPEVKNRAVLTKAVLFTKARCLTKLGRTADAEKARQQGEAVR